MWVSNALSGFSTSSVMQCYLVLHTMFKKYIRLLPKLFTRPIVKICLMLVHYSIAFIKFHIDIPGYRWAEGFIGWGQPCRMRHVTSGRYLAVTEDNNVVTFHRSVATEDATAFLLRQSKVRRRNKESRHEKLQHYISEKRRSVIFLTGLMYCLIPHYIQMSRSLVCS